MKKIDEDFTDLVKGLLNPESESRLKDLRMVKIHPYLLGEIASDEEVIKEIGRRVQLI